MKRIRNLFISLALLFGVMAPLVPVAVVQADSKATVCESIGGCTNGANGSASISKVIKTVINILGILVGAAAVIMIIVSGLKFISSGGDGQSIAAAKKSLTYAIIGLVIAVSATTLVHFVLGHVK